MQTWVAENLTCSKWNLLYRNKRRKIIEFFRPFLRQWWQSYDLWKGFSPQCVVIWRQKQDCSICPDSKTEIDVHMRAVFLVPLPLLSIRCTHENLESIPPSPHTQDAHFHEMGEVAMVIAYESPEARALIFQRTLRCNEKILKIDEEDWMDVWAPL